jgi:hypothetical protein
MRKLIVAFVLCASLGAVAAAQTSVLPDRFHSWEAEGPAQTVATKDLVANWPQAADAQAVLKEAGLSAIEQRVYQSGQDEITVRAFTLKDPSSAYEVYTFLLAPGMRSMGAGKDSALGQYDTLSPNTKPESLNDLVPALKSKADLSPLPPLKTYLPKEWRIFGSERYALGPNAFRAALTALNQGVYAGLSNEVGFQDGAEAILAQYKGEHGSGVLLLLEYPTPQVAENRRHHLEEALAAAAKPAGVTVERKASLLSLVFDATSAMHAQAIRDAVDYETQVTWNEPHQSATDPPLVQMLYKIFLFTSLFLVVATVTGIAFGGFRILIKHWLPGKVFDRPENIEVLQLGLSGKKIDPTDMY